MATTGWLRRFWLMLLPAALWGCSSNGLRVPQSPLLAALERKSGLIAYVGPEGNIYTIDQGGGRLRAITEDADGQTLRYDLPTWAPDSRELAFVGIRTSENGRTTVAVYTAEANGRDLTELYSSDLHLPFYLYWSPDAEWLSFLTSPAGDRRAPLAMQVTPAQGGETSVVDTGRPYYWAWSPNENKVLVHAGGSAQVNPSGARLSFLEVDPRVHEIGLGIAPTNFQAPDYSPDGAFVLFAGDAGEGQQALMLANASGQVQASITDYSGVIAFDWAPLGDYVAYVVGEDPSVPVIGELAFLDLRDPADPETIPVDEEQVFGFFWAPDGKQLAYFRFVLIESDSQEGQESAGGEGFFLELYVADPRSGETKRLTSFQPTPSFFNLLVNFDQYQRSMTIWSPDSNYLVIPAFVSQDQQGLVIVPASGDFELRFLTQGLVASWSWQ